MNFSMEMLSKTHSLPFFGRKRNKDGVEEKYWVRYKGKSYLYKKDTEARYGFGEILCSYLGQRLGFECVNVYPAKDFKSNGVIVESFLKKAGLIENVTYFKEMYIHEIQDKWGIDLSSISNNGEAEKRFDFVVKGKSTVYGIETNFYTSGGSKLNETARSYKTITIETKDLEYFKFVWITDGRGWTNAKKNLKETFDILDNLYNIKDMEDGIISKALK